MSLYPRPKRGDLWVTCHEGLGFEDATNDPRSSQYRCYAFLDLFAPGPAIPVGTIILITEPRAMLIGTTEAQGWTHTALILGRVVRIDDGDIRNGWVRPYLEGTLSHAR